MQVWGWTNLYVRLSGLRDTLIASELLSQGESVRLCLEKTNLWDSCLSKKTTLTHGGKSVEFIQPVEGPNRTRTKGEVDLVCLFKLGHLSLRSICYLPLFVEFQFQPGHLYAKPPKVHQDYFLWNGVGPLYSLVKIVYHFHRTSSSKSLHPLKWLTVPSLQSLLTFKPKYVQHKKTGLYIKFSIYSTYILPVTSHLSTYVILSSRERKNIWQMLCTLAESPLIFLHSEIRL